MKRKPVREIPFTVQLGGAYCGCGKGIAYLSVPMTQKFKPGDYVRVRVELLPKRRKGEKK